MLREGRAEAKNRDGRAEEGVQLIGDECVEDARKKPEPSSRQRPCCIGGCGLLSPSAHVPPQTYLIVLSPIPVYPVRALNSYCCDLYGCSTCNLWSSSVWELETLRMGIEHEVGTRRESSWIGNRVSQPSSCTCYLL